VLGHPAAAWGGLAPQGLNRIVRSEAVGGVLVVIAGVVDHGGVHLDARHDRRQRRGYRLAVRVTPRAGG